MKMSLLIYIINGRKKYHSPVARIDIGKLLCRDIIER